MTKVFVVDANKQPLNPVHPGYARLLLKQGKAAVLRRYPFVLILHAEVEMPPLEPLRVKLDPGSKTTGLALVNDATGEVIFAAEIMHRGAEIKQALDGRRGVRRRRSHPHPRHPTPTFSNPHR